MTSPTDRYDPQKVLLDEVLEEYSWVADEQYLAEELDDHHRARALPMVPNTDLAASLSSYKYRLFLLIDLTIWSRDSSPNFDGRGRLTYYLRQMGYPPSSYMNMAPYSRVLAVMRYADHFNLVK